MSKSHERPSRRLVLEAAGALAALGSAPRALAAETIKVGYTGPLSGSLSLLGQGVRDGLSVCFALVNDQGGINGAKLELVAEDDAYEPMRTLAAVKKLIEQDKVAALVSPAGTPNTAALLPLVQESKLPLLFPYAFSHALTNPVKPYVFTTLPEVRVQMKVLANYVLTTLKQTKVAAIYQNDDFGQDAVVGLEERFARDKVLLQKLPFDRGSTNFSGVVTQARQADVGHVVFLGIPRDAALVLKEMSKIGWRPQFSGHNALGDPQTFQLAGQLADGAFAVAVMEPLDSEKPAVKEFLAAQKKYLPKTQPTTYSMHAYNAARIFVEAVERAGGKTAPDTIVSALEAMKNFDSGLMAPVSFSKEEHAGSLSGAIMKAENGKWQVITEWMKVS
jgi:branched-chain amino acid transport system substrate-binding protein